MRREMVLFVLFLQCDSGSCCLLTPVVSLDRLLSRRSPEIFIPQQGRLEGTRARGCYSVERRSRRPTTWALLDARFGAHPSIQYSTKKKQEFGCF